MLQVRELFQRTGLCGLRTVACLLIVIAVCAGLAVAQAPAIPPSSQFDINGFLQSATLNAGGARAGGTLTVNNHVITVPANLIVILPANALTWQELFAKAPAPYTGVATGMAMNDSPTPLTTFEVHVIGNRVGDQYIAGMVEIAQNALNSGAGYINFIDYTLGEMRVGGVMGSNTTGARVRINDPLGRYGRVNSPDVRFTVDPDNPTITAGTGYPMCLPRTNPNVADDAQCPRLNRPTILDPVTNTVVTAMAFTTPPINNIATDPIVFPDSRYQAPFMLGDYVFYSGLLVADCPTCAANVAGTIAGPMTPSTTTFISADTITGNNAIWTADGSNPAYARIDVGLIGTGGLSVLGVGEAAVRSRWEGMTTDRSRNINLYGMDFDPASGAVTDRYFGTIGVDQGPPTGAQQGRWRFRPPCLPFGSVPTKPERDCVMNQAGTFLPPPREVRAVVAGLESQGSAPVLVANGIAFGQYHAPIDEYIFPENFPGTPMVENNFNAIPFLACGGYSSSGIDFVPTAPTLIQAPLSPWPSNIPPAACAGSVLPPTGLSATATPNPVAAGGLVTLASALATGTAPITYAWVQTSPATPLMTLNTPLAASTTFTAPVSATAQTFAFQVTASNAQGSAVATASVVVSAAGQPTVNHIAPLTVSSGTAVTLRASAIDPSGSKVQFQFQQLSGTPVVLNPNPTAFGGLVNSGATFNGPSFTVSLPIGTPGTTLGFQVVAKNQAGVLSAPEFFTVTINPQADVVSVTTAQFRTGKVRLDLTVTSSVISPTVTLSLDSYRANDGTTVTGPFPLTNTGGGIYTLTLVGSKPPICQSVNGPLATPCSQTPITVRSNLGGVSPATALTNIRQ